MTNEVLVAIISGFCVGAPTIIATITSNKAHDRVVDERIKYLSEQLNDLKTKFDKQDDIKEKIVILDQKVTAEHQRLDAICEQLKGGNKK